MVFKLHFKPSESNKSKIIQEVVTIPSQASQTSQSQTADSVLEPASKETIFNGKVHVEKLVGGWCHGVTEHVGA